MSSYARPETSESLIQRYQDQVQKQRALICQLQGLRDMLASLENGFRVLLADEHFTTLLRAEDLDRVPTVLANPGVTREHANGETDAFRLLQSNNLSTRTRYELTRMIPSRREESARLMIASGCFISPYVRALIGASDEALVANPKGRPRQLVMKSPQRDVANREISEIAAQLKELSGLTGADLIVLFVSARYVQRLLSIARVRRYMKKRWPEILNELEDTVKNVLDSESLSLE